MLIAVTHPVSPTLAECELTHLAREPIDVARATAQHAAYEQRLCELGARIVRVPAAPELPDAVFVEDTAIVLAEIAVIPRPGAPRRRLETAAGPPLPPPARRRSAPATCCRSGAASTSAERAGPTRREASSSGASWRRSITRWSPSSSPVEIGRAHV